MDGPGAVIPDALRFRAPGSAVIAETLRVHAQDPPLSAIQRLFGRSPLSTDAQAWYLGALGELEVGEILDGLGDEWHTIHSVPVGHRGSDIDHVVIGPGGVFTVNTKFHEGGRVWVGSRRILVNGQRTEYLRNAEFEASRAAKILGGAARRPVSVTPILAIVSARGIQIRERPERVEVVRADALARRLERAPRTLDAAEIAALVHVAVDPATWSAVRPPVPDLTAFASLRTSVATARRRRRVWAAGGLIAILAAFAVIAGPGLGMFPG
ncbi:nuclease-related domain-containing protein [Microbacterium sp. 22242]|uniref:nuclease-related domain-containing protein n=1 Tax=Microbacterium sp. 22242 TaxID=3453896 RepID=UPI003F86B7FE